MMTREQQQHYASLANAAEIRRLETEVERLQAPFRFVGADDWEYVMRALDGCGRNAFWRQVLTEIRAALEPTP